MGLPRFENINRPEAAKMTFEARLKQIKGLRFSDEYMNYFHMLVGFILEETNSMVDDENHSITHDVIASTFYQFAFTEIKSLADIDTNRFMGEVANLTQFTLAFLSSTKDLDLNTYQQTVDSVVSFTIEEISEMKNIDTEIAKNILMNVTHSIFNELDSLALYEGVAYSELLYAVVSRTFGALENALMYDEVLFEEVKTTYTEQVKTIFGLEGGDLPTILAEIHENYEKDFNEYYGQYITVLQFMLAQMSRLDANNYSVAMAESIAELKTDNEAAYDQMYSLVNQILVDIDPTSYVDKVNSALLKLEDEDNVLFYQQFNRLFDHMTRKVKYGIEQYTPLYESITKIAAKMKRKDHWAAPTPDEIVSFLNTMTNAFLYDMRLFKDIDMVKFTDVLKTARNNFFATGDLLYTNEAELFAITPDTCYRALNQVRELFTRYPNRKQAIYTDAAYKNLRSVAAQVFDLQNIPS